MRRHAAIQASSKGHLRSQFVLDPQPDDSVNDPLNWPVWQRDAALVSLGFYCFFFCVGTADRVRELDREGR
jgi:hypothetical protein